MITKEMIKKGFETGVVSIEEEYAGCLGICCRIGDNAFYFVGSGDTDLTKEEYWKSYPLDITVDMLFDILKSSSSAEENGIDCDELAYYESVLMENCTFRKEKDKSMFEVQSGAFFDNGMNLGHATVFMNRDSHATKFEIIFEIAENREWHFHYENNVCLNHDERVDFEKWARKKLFRK